MDEGFTKQLALRTTEAEYARIERVSKMIQIASTAAVMRAALRIGLDVLEKDPARILDPQPIGESERCMAELRNGARCGATATAYDRERLGPVCDKHLKE